MAGKPVVFDLMPPICPFAMINEVIRSVKSRFFCVRLNALASNNNSALHVGIIHRSLVNSQRSDQSDHDTRICFHRWAASKQSLQDTPSFFLPHSTLEPVRGLLFDFLRECLSSWSTQFEPNFVLLSPFHLYSSRCLKAMSLVRILP